MYPASLGADTHHGAPMGWSATTKTANPRATAAAAAEVADARRNPSATGSGSLEIATVYVPGPETSSTAPIPIEEYSSPPGTGSASYVPLASVNGSRFVIPSAAEPMK